MTRVDRDKYSVLIRGDYLYALGRLAPTRQERDKLIQEAVESFVLDYSFNERAKWIREEQSRVGIMFPAGRQPPHYMYLEFIRLPDGLVNRLERASRHPDFGTQYYDSLGTGLNAAIRLYLKKGHSNLLRMDTDSGNEAVLTNNQA
jgi:hypothetical protein